MRNTIAVIETLYGDYEGTLSQSEYVSKVQKVIDLTLIGDDLIIAGMLDLMPATVFDKSTAEDLCELVSTNYHLMNYYVKRLEAVA